jgi:hypothetical protein
MFITEEEHVKMVVHSDHMTKYEEYKYMPISYGLSDSTVNISDCIMRSEWKSMWREAIMA